ncbi:hypothetical protein G4177_11625 [Corallococcus sp. ZKHCc1 1396]|uniref:Glycosyl transferase n=1 Tax=Corallococcus soli TaxID=2710757 RepID=A0ABR9PLL1_9BACT|nr:hypothetical protein [Corallococcus soli]MBE4748811.1 hypothetical protein [Corallococcus soli]
MSHPSVGHAVPDALDGVLETDPARVYAVMDGPTRARYREVCVALAGSSARTPEEVAREAVNQASASQEHVGMFLLGQGLPRLEAALGYRRSWASRLGRGLQRRAANLYVGGLIGSSVLALVALERFLAAQGLPVSQRLGLLALLVLPVVELIQELVDRLLAASVRRPPVLPKLDPEQVFRAETRTLVITPLLVASGEDIDAQYQRMENHFLGNDSPALSFALLTDFPDADAKELPGEHELLARLDAGVRELNARHGFQEAPRFHWLHRERRWNPVSRRWMGWERKRGKLEEFNRLVLGARDTSYVGEVPDVVRSVRYAITLDADTQLLPGSAARLVATLHHPLNRARFDAAGLRVVSGYSMLQPALGEAPTRMSWRASGGWPVSLVRELKQAPPNMGQSLFGVGEFVGKGIYDVAAFHRALDGRIPENAVLSHDKLEGMFSRVAFAQDITVLEGRSPDLAGTARIWHRWVRGDYQLMPWILPWVPGRDGRFTPTPLTALDRWKLLSDLRAPLSFPSALAVITYGWVMSPGGTPPSFWALATLLWLCRHMLLLGVGAMVRDAFRTSSLTEALHFVRRRTGHLLMGTLMTVATVLPFTTIVLDAIVRALYRMGVDRSRILDWTTHSQATRQVRALSSFRLPEVWGSTVLTLLIGGALWRANPAALPWAAPLLLGWIPLAAFARTARAPRALPSHAADGDRALAKRVWERFEASAKPVGDDVLTPTDLALELVAPLAAYHLGLLDAAALGVRLEAVQDLAASLARNGEQGAASDDTRMRQPLEPRGADTAENGVLAAALVVLEQGLRAVTRGASTSQDAGVISRLERAASRARESREAMDFAGCYDAETGLLRTGPGATSHETLLASGGGLAGFVGIAMRQLPLQHWAALLDADRKTRAEGRGPVGVSGARAQLLPSLFLAFPVNTLLADGARTVLDAACAAEAPVEVQALALRFRPELSAESLVRGVEAADRRALGVTFLALTNRLCDDVLSQHFHQHRQTAWVETLVYEMKDVS